MRHRALEPYPTPQASFRFSRRPVHTVPQLVPRFMEEVSSIIAKQLNLIEAVRIQYAFIRALLRHEVSEVRLHFFTVSIKCVDNLDYLTVSSTIFTEPAAFSNRP